MSPILPADLLRHIQRKFAKGERAAAITLLLSARSHEGLAAPRLQRCALVASNGSLERLMHYVRMLEVDYRDSKDFPIVSRHFFDSCFFCRALLSEEGQTASL